MTERIAKTIANLITGFIGFVVLGSMTLAGLWLNTQLGPRDKLVLELSPDDIAMTLAQSDSYEIHCDKTGESCKIGLKK